MTINEAQKEVLKHIQTIGYDKIETDSLHVFLHLTEEIGEVARSLLHSRTNRGSLPVNSEPGDLCDEVADVFWQLLKLASYLDIDLEDAFVDKFQKNRDKNKQK